MKYVLAVLAMCLVGCINVDLFSFEAKAKKTCYWCKESIKGGALICKHCGKYPVPRGLAPGADAGKGGERVVTPGQKLHQPPPPLRRYPAQP